MECRRRGLKAQVREYLLDDFFFENGRNNLGVTPAVAASGDIDLKDPLHEPTPRDLSGRGGWFGFSFI